jgi:hypothetical protein
MTISLAGTVRTACRVDEWSSGQLPELDQVVAVGRLPPGR